MYHTTCNKNTKITKYNYITQPAKKYKYTTQPATKIQLYHTACHTKYKYTTQPAAKKIQICTTTCRKIQIYHTTCHKNTLLQQNLPHKIQIYHTACHKKTIIPQNLSQKYKSTTQPATKIQTYHTACYKKYKYSIKSPANLQTYHKNNKIKSVKIYLSTFACWAFCLPSPLFFEFD